MTCLDRSRAVLGSDCLEEVLRQRGRALLVALLGALYVLRNRMGWEV